MGNDPVKKVLEDMKNAKDNASEQCPNLESGYLHDFSLLMHVDGKDSYSNYYKCSHCQEVVVRTQKRKGKDKMFWEMWD